ncbi:MAG: ABC transporter ATP-binding protein [Clostridia bacterium]|nr:ABC transporter ATP-binding protein [Clostridia bacterium]
MSETVLELKDLSYSYTKGGKNVINELSLTFEKGKIYSIVGKSGAGKTTLLSLLSGLAKPTSGKILYNGKDIAKINKYNYRSKLVGVVFQSFNLLPYLNATENVVLSMDISGKKIKHKKAEAKKLLQKVNLEEEDLNRGILKLSGGQQQRVAIARALANEPDIIFADEPTGNLDNDTQKDIMEILKNLANEGKCIIIVTHSPEVSKMSDVVYELKSVGK